MKSFVEFNQRGLEDKRRACGPAGSCFGIILRNGKHVPPDQAVRLINTENPYGPSVDLHPRKVSTLHEAARDGRLAPFGQAVGRVALEFGPEDILLFDTEHAEDGSGLKVSIRYDFSGSEELQHFAGQPVVGTGAEAVAFIEELSRPDSTFEVVYNRASYTTAT